MFLITDKQIKTLWGYGIAIAGDTEMSPLKNRYSTEETSRVEYSECAKNLLHGGSLGNMTYSLRC